MNSESDSSVSNDWYTRVAIKNGVSRDVVVEYVKKLISGIVPKKRLTLVV